METTTVLRTMEFSKTKTIICLTYSNLNEETQEQLLIKSKNEVEKWYGSALEIHALKNQLDYKTLLEEEAIRNLYNYKFVFTI